MTACPRKTFEEVSEEEKSKDGGPLNHYKTTPEITRVRNYTRSTTGRNIEFTTLNIDHHGISSIMIIQREIKLVIVYVDS